MARARAVARHGGGGGGAGAPPPTGVPGRGEGRAALRPQTMEGAVSHPPRPAGLGDWRPRPAPATHFSGARRDRRAPASGDHRPLGRAALMRPSNFLSLLSFPQASPAAPRPPLMRARARARRAATRRPPWRGSSRCVAGEGGRERKRGRGGRCLSFFIQQGGRPRPRQAEGVGRSRSRSLARLTASPLPPSHHTVAHPQLHGRHRGPPLLRHLHGGDLPLVREGGGREEREQRKAIRKTSTLRPPALSLSLSLSLMSSSLFPSPLPHPPGTSSASPRATRWTSCPST